MATYNAKKLTIVKGSDTYIIDPLQGNDSIYNDRTVVIHKSDWSGTVPYTYIYEDSYITANCGISVYFKDGVRGGLVGDLGYTKTTGAVIFVTTEPAAGDIPLVVRIIDSLVNGVYPVDASAVATTVVEGETTVQGALENLDNRTSDLEEGLANAEDELAIRLKSVNGVEADENGNAQINEVPFARQIVTDDSQQSVDEFLFRTTGGEASLTDGPAKLVSISGCSVHTGVVEESLQLFVSLAERDPSQEPITAEIDRDTFIEYVSESGTIMLTYSESAWSANPALYGITVTGTPIDGDVLTVIYVKADRGTIMVSNPTKFISTGWNLYNNATGKKYARVKKYSTEHDFIIGGSYTALEFSETLEGVTTTVTPESGHFDIPSDGYIWVTGGDDTTYIMMTWSDWTEGYQGNFATYTESVVDLTPIMANFNNGLFQVGSVSDEIDFSMLRAISRIERLAYTDANLEYAESSGRDYDADNNYIYIVKETEDVYVITETGDYSAYDHGVEIIDGDIPVRVKMLYGQNLVDKLRTDVLTRSQDLVNNLTTNDSTKALSAAQGYALNGNIASLTTTVNGKQNTLSVTSTTATYLKLYKYGRIVFGILNTNENKSASSTSWINLASLPSGYRPIADFHFTAIDNLSSSQALEVRVLSNGNVDVYIPKASTSYRPYGFFTFVASN